MVNWKCDYEGFIAGTHAFISAKECMGRCILLAPNSNLFWTKMLSLLRGAFETNKKTISVAGVAAIVK